MLLLRSPVLGNMRVDPAKTTPACPCTADVTVSAEFVRLSCSGGRPRRRSVRLWELEYFDAAWYAPHEQYLKRSVGAREMLEQYISESKT